MGKRTDEDLEKYKKTMPVDARAKLETYRKSDSDSDDGFGGLFD